MKIIKRGSSEKPVTTTECSDCGCVFEFTKDEARFVGEPRDGPAYVVKCPEPFCAKEIWIDAKLVK